MGIAGLIWRGFIPCKLHIGSSGLGDWIGQGLTILGNVPPIVLILAVATLIIFLTEITSNVATTSTFLPVVGAVAVALGIAPVALTIPVVLAASCAFMLPVATPPNAIVFGSGKLTIPDMIRAGFALNIIGVFSGYSICLLFSSNDILKFMNLRAVFFSLLFVSFNALGAS